MPCDAQAVRYCEMPGGTDTIVTPDGKTVRGFVTQGGGDGVGYLPHWASCRAAGSFHKAPAVKKAT